jgi:predicted dehydrogenase
MPDPIRIGIIGCGEVAQIIHLPSLAELPDRFRVTAICDVSRQVLDGVGTAWGIARRFADPAELLAHPDVDAVLVANPHVHHAETALAAMAAGRHVLLEKPICLTLREADALIAAEARTGVTVQVGFMRRYAPAFLEAKQIVAALPGIRLARVHDVIGRNALINRDVARVIRGTDIAPALGEQVQTLQAAAIAEAIGPAPPALAGAYMLLLGLASHDTSAMRELLGAPRAVLYAAHRWAGRFVTAAFDYGDFVCHLEVGVDSIPRFGAHIEIYGGDRSVRIDYDTPYVRHVPARLTVTDAKAESGVASTTGFANRMDSFVLEWQAFHASITQRQPPKTSLSDAREDLTLFASMVASMRANE